MMEALIQKMRQTARDLLAQGQVEAVYGYTQGSAPMACRPFVARTPEETDRLWWDEFCVLNLVNFLPRGTEGRYAVVAKGCDSRNLVVRHQERQLDLKEQVTVLGVPCQGMLEPELIRKATEGREIDIREVRIEGDQVKVSGPGFELSLNKAEVTRETCLTCRHPNPVVESVLLAEKVPEDPDRDKDARVREVEALAPAERQDFFRRLFSTCVRCYACRNACPLCYCNLCFVDESKPQWLGKSIEEADTLTYHFLRAYHCAGRCTDCGACESACPVGIPMRILTRKLEKDIKEAYGYEAGLDIEVQPPLTVFRPDDPENFMHE